MGKKLAFLFLTVKDVAKPKWWLQFWHGHDSLYTIYAHTKEWQQLSPHSWLRQFQIPEHVPTKWATNSLVHASLLLLKYAFQNTDNQWFLLLSDSCIPIAPFPIIYHELMYERHVSLFRHNPYYHEKIEHEHRYYRFDGKDHIPLADFRKGHQWWILHRSAVEKILQSIPQTVHWFDRVFAADEHYFITMMIFLKLPFEYRESTFVQFKSGHSHPEVWKSIPSTLLLELQKHGFWFFRKVVPETILS